ncbi:MAG TPA: ABC transporter permease [Chloroflexota bacterium]
MATRLEAATPLTPAASPAAVRAGRSPAAEFLQRLLGMRLARVGGAIVLVVGLAALLAVVAAPYSPTQQDIRNLLQPPGPSHPFGTDELGRDTLTRVLYGAQASLEVGIIAVGISLLVGCGLGLVAGYLRGLADATIMRVMDGLLALPTLVLALAITAMLGPGLNNAMIAIGITGVPVFARLVRGQVLSVRELEYILATRSVGAPDGRIMLRHILPNVLAPIVVQASLAMPTAILAEAGLSFLGLGVQPPTASWGAMLNTAKGYLQQDPWLAVAPGTAIFVTMLGFNFLGDAIRDALDPRLRG